MSGPVNLNKARKASGKIKKRQQADENAVKFGHNKGERMAVSSRIDKARAVLDQHRIEDE